MCLRFVKDGGTGKIGINSFELLLEPVAQKLHSNFKQMSYSHSSANANIFVNLLQVLKISICSNGVT